MSEYWNNIRNVISGTIRDGKSPLQLPEIFGSMLCSDYGVRTVEVAAVEQMGWLGKLKEEFAEPDYWNAVHQAYHLFRFIQETGILGIQDIGPVLEIGGGYGCMRRVLWVLGHRQPYSILDFPEMVEMQSGYLGGGIPTSFPMALMGGVQFDTVFAMWSLSECPLPTRGAILDSFNANRMWFGFQDSFEGVDNQAWALTLPLVLTFPIPHRPGNYYGLVGR